MSGPASILNVPEKQFRQMVVDVARHFGWRVYFTWQSRHSPEGFPDLFMVRNGQALAVELKTGSRRPTQAQEEWLRDLAQVLGIRAYVWRPTSWAAIIRILSDGRAEVML